MFPDSSLSLRKQYRDSHIEHHTDDVVGNGDERTGGNGGVYLQFFQRHRDQCAEDGCEHHDGKKAERYGIGYGGLGSETDEIVDIYQERNDGGIDECHNRFLQDLLPGVVGIQGTVGNSLSQR